MPKTNLIKEFINKKDANPKETPFSESYYHWLMFMINHARRIPIELNIDLESFLIIQTIASHSVYLINKKGSKSFSNLEEEFELLFTSSGKKKNIHKLKYSTVAQVLEIPRETVRRKITTLVKKKILKVSPKTGICLDKNYLKIYNEFAYKTSIEIAKLVRKWNNIGVINKILEFSNKYL